MAERANVRGPEPAQDLSPLSLQARPGGDPSGVGGGPGGAAWCWWRESEGLSIPPDSGQWQC